MTNPALWTAIAGLVTAIGSVVGLVLHVKGPQHQGPAAGPPAK
jgi:hypothetical protein